MNAVCRFEFAGGGELSRASSSGMAARHANMPALRLGVPPWGVVRCAPMFLAAILASVAVGAEPPSLPAPVDDAVFRDALRERGLDPWLKQYFADSAKPDEIDARMRRREVLLREAASVDLPSGERESRIVQAREILAELVLAHPDHPGRFRWYLEMARDDLERQDPVVFRDLLLYDLPGRGRRKAHDLSRRGVEVLRRLRNEVTEAWSYVESLDEAGIDQITASGSLAVLEVIDIQSEMLLGWARLYEALSVEPAAPRPADVFAEVLADATDRHGWVDLPAGREPEQCGALLMAAVAARHLGQPGLAEGYAGRVVQIAAGANDPALRQRLALTAWLAALEQIRAKRDAGQLDAALQDLSRAREQRASAGVADPAAGLALTLLEGTIEAHRLSGAPGVTTQRGLAGLLLGRFALAPLQRFGEVSPANRDALYALFAPAVVTEPLAAPRPLFERQLLIGAAVADAASPPAEVEAAVRARLAEALATGRETLSLLPAGASEAARGELLFLLGRAHYLVGSPLRAVADLCDLVERVPAHDRCPRATREAAAIALEELRRAGRTASPEVREAFIRAGRLLRAKFPDDAEGRLMQYFIAAALEAEGRLEEAAAAYALVPAGVGHDLAAALGRVRCWRAMLNLASTRPAGDEIPGRAWVEEALKAARAAAATVRSAGGASASSASSEDHCLAADLVVATADLLNLPAVGESDEAVKLLEGFEAAYADCPGVVGPALRQRIIALRQLNRLAEAGAVVDAFLAADSQGAGAVMAGLLEAMRNEIESAADRGDEKAVADTAREAVRLGETLLAWSGKNAGRVSVEDLLTIRLWFAWSLLYAGREDKALATFDECDRAAQSILPAHSLRRHEIRLGRAQALLSKGRPAEALPLFSEAWQRLPERSPGWWQAFVGSLTCHARLGHDREQIRQSIRQQRFLAPELGGPRWRRALEALESAKSKS